MTAELHSAFFEASFGVMTAQQAELNGPVVYQTFVSNGLAAAVVRGQRWLVIPVASHWAFKRDDVLVIEGTRYRVTDVMEGAGYFVPVGWLVLSFEPERG